MKFIQSLKRILKRQIDETEDVTNNVASDEQHQRMIDAMSPFLDNGKPKVGIFWYDIANNVLFGVEKDDAEKYVADTGYGTLGKLHKTYWQKQHHRAIAKGITDSIFYIESNYTKIPRGRVFVKNDGVCHVAVGKWFDGIIDGEKVFDTQNVRELIADEFNLPDDFEVVYDEHWDLGHGWSGDVFH